MSNAARQGHGSGVRGPDLAGESLATRVRELRFELATESRQLEDKRVEVSALECRVLLSECIQSAQLLTATLAELVRTADEQGTLPEGWKRTRIQNCRRAIASALLWIGKG